jgi:hypothetical protein
VNSRRRRAEREIGFGAYPKTPRWRSHPVADLVFVLITVALFAAFTGLVRAVER